ncbi:dTDP-glucose 4,6-dehydratase [bacterium]|nr:dTDP-glucose 4,6-dehydratase [candidate division CSSED10-310 bacterium]
MGNRYLVTGGAGFIGANFIHFLLKKYPDCAIVNLDKLTYAGNLDNLKSIEHDPRYTFVQGDICDAECVKKVFAGGVNYVFNFAAETHVDRSIQDPSSFIRTDVLGAYVLADAALKHGVNRFVQISTDEVYGSIQSGSFSESDPLNPSSPYSASKAGGELVVMSYFTTYQLPVIVTRASNNYGPYQYPEKLIPLFVTNAIESRSLPLYGDGSNVRDWLYVEDHCTALDIICEKGIPGQIYNIGGSNERSNLEITRKILSYLSKSESLIRRVKDRPGHDWRYSIDSIKLRNLGWQPSHDFEKGLHKTIDWYVSNSEWWEKLKSKNDAFIKHYKSWYQDKLGLN